METTKNTDISNTMTKIFKMCVSIGALIFGMSMLIFFVYVLINILK